jgi:hypothetical protein
MIKPLKQLPAAACLKYGCKLFLKPAFVNILLHEMI